MYNLLYLALAQSTEAKLCTLGNRLVALAAQVGVGTVGPMWRREVD
ncbi:MAG: hypothetical protein FWG16_01535 [Micrococcales bacterium]|nr:hypothetical protein [Micrococcales bacterium]